MLNTNDRIDDMVNEILDNTGMTSRRTLIKGAGAVGLFGAFPTAVSAATSATTIKRVKSNGLTYERITTQPQLLQKIYSSDFNFSTFSGRSQTPADRAKSGGYSAVINCDSWANVDGSAYYNDPNIFKRPVGIQVYNGKLLQNFGYTHSEISDSDHRALYMTKDYRLRHINRGLNDKDMQKYLTDHGALWSAGYTSYLVNYGKMVNFAPGGGVSAKTLLGQRADGTIVIIVIHGKTGVYGATTRQCAELMRDEKCYNAINLDGGGSSQIYWNGKYVHPSSDPSGARRLGGGYLAIKGAVPSFS